MLHVLGAHQNQHMKRTLPMMLPHSFRVFFSFGGGGGDFFFFFPFAIANFRHWWAKASKSDYWKDCHTLQSRGGIWFVFFIWELFVVLLDAYIVTVAKNSCHLWLSRRLHPFSRNVNLSIVIHVFITPRLSITQHYTPGTRRFYWINRQPALRSGAWRLLTAPGCLLVCYQILSKIWCLISC